MGKTITFFFIAVIILGCHSEVTFDFELINNLERTIENNNEIIIEQIKIHENRVELSKKHGKYIFRLKTDSILNHYSNSVKEIGIMI